MIRLAISKRQRLVSNSITVPSGTLEPGDVFTQNGTRHRSPFLEDIQNKPLPVRRRPGALLEWVTSNRRGGELVGYAVRYADFQIGFLRDWFLNCRPSSRRASYGQQATAKFWLASGLVETADGFAENGLLAIADDSVRDVIERGTPLPVGAGEAAFGSGGEAARHGREGGRGFVPRGPDPRPDAAAVSDIRAMSAETPPPSDDGTVETRDEAASTTLTAKGDNPRRVGLRDKLTAGTVRAQGEVRSAGATAKTDEAEPKARGERGVVRRALSNIRSVSRAFGDDRQQGERVQQNGDGGATQRPTATHQRVSMTRCAMSIRRVLLSWDSRRSISNARTSSTP